jgi:glutamate mutase epsilon subunit
VELGTFVRQCRERGELVVQPRMGMADPALMASGLRAVRDAPACAVGTITLDSYTRVGDYADAAAALGRRSPLNGYPIVSHDPGTTKRFVAEIERTTPVQVRHGSARPKRIFRAMAEAGLSASEGGPVSYCLPYGRTPLAESVGHWRDAVDQLVQDGNSRGFRPHLESFGGCLLGQLCPPSLLLAVSVLECMFFVQNGVDSVSLSYAQQTNAVQDVEALAALRALAQHYLPDRVDWHIVLYTYMGVYPRTPPGAQRLLELSAELAVRGQAERLVVKTVSEAWRIPTVAENIDALVRASRRAAMAAGLSTLPWADRVDHTDVVTEAQALIEAVLNISDDFGRALLRAFSMGLLDVPYCLHQDNRGMTRGLIDSDGRLQWAQVGNLPLKRTAAPTASPRPIRARDLMGMLHFNAQQNDAAIAGGRPSRSAGFLAPAEGQIDQSQQ